MDSDFDDVSDTDDQCPGFDDLIDMDQDGTPDGCDSLIDSDGDGRADFADACNGHDDAIDEDMDNIPDGCDSFVGVETESQSNSVMMQGVVALAAVMLVALLSILALSVIRKGKPPTIQTPEIPEAVSYTHLTLPTILLV